MKYIDQSGVVPRYAVVPVCITAIEISALAGTGLTTLVQS